MSIFKRFLNWIKSKLTKTPEPPTLTQPVSPEPLEPPASSQEPSQATPLPSPPVETPVEPPKAPNVDLPVSPPASEETLAQYALKRPDFSISLLAGLLYFAGSHPGMSNKDTVDAFLGINKLPEPPAPQPQEPSPDFLFTGNIDVETLTRDDFCFIHVHQEVDWFRVLRGSLLRYNQGINDAFYNGLAFFNEKTYTGPLLSYAKLGLFNKNFVKGNKLQ